MPKKETNASDSLARLARFQTASGGAKGPLPKDAAEFLRRQSKTVRWYRIDPSVRTRPWLVAAIKKANGDSAALTASIVARLQNAPTEQNLTDAQVILNELTRTPEGAEGAAHQLTDDNIELITRLSGKQG